MIFEYPSLPQFSSEASSQSVWPLQNEDKLIFVPVLQLIDVSTSEYGAAGKFKMLLPSELYNSGTLIVSVTVDNELLIDHVM